MIKIFPGRMSPLDELKRVALARIDFEETDPVVNELRQVCLLFNNAF